jgi:hypothetical protein
MTWPEKLEILCDIYGARGTSLGPESLNEAEMTLFCVRPFSMEMTGGAFWAFFYNSTGSYVEETLAALHRIRAEESARLLSQAVTIYFGGHPIPVDTQERRELLNALQGDRTPEAD